MALERVQVTVPADLLEFAKGLIDGQDFSCLDDVIVAALADLQTTMASRRQAQVALKAEVQKGLDEVNRGEVFDEETVFGELDEILGRKPEPAA
jgi:Arc/MetJ-type ribon-helix-helix transcriptional regulator